MSWYDLNSDLEPVEREVQWKDNYVYYLVILYQRHECLWKKDSPLYLNYHARRQAYHTIHEEVSGLGVTVVEVIMKLRDIRKAYVDELKKIVEAEAFGYSYKSRYVWFDTLNDFLCMYLHVHENEIVEKPLSEDYWSSLYGNEDNESRSTRSDEIPCSELSKVISILRPPSSDYSTTYMGSPRRPHPNRSDLTQIKKFRNASAKDLPRISSDVRNSGPTECLQPPQRTKLPSEKRGCADACESESIQGIITNEGSMGLSSRQSWLTARISCDQFDLFAANVVSRLKQMNADDAATAQMEIQRILRGVVRDTESNAPIINTFAEENDDPNYKIISILPCPQDRSWVSQESNIND